MSNPKRARSSASFERAVSILRHDMRHFLLSISSYIENNENEKALDYINEVIHTSDKTALQRYCKNNIVNLILSSHEGEMKKKQITFQYTIQIPEKLRISDVDLTALLSNGLENAIHAVSDLPMPKRIIRLDMHMNHDKLLISLKILTPSNLRSLMDFLILLKPDMDLVRRVSGMLLKNRMEIVSLWWMIGSLRCGSFYKD